MNSDTESLREPSERHRREFLRFWAIGFSLLIFATVPLWNPIALLGSAYPRVSWIELAQSKTVIAVIESAFELFLAVAVSVAVINPGRRAAWWAIAGMLWALILMDQHRLQPWAYQTLAYCLIAGGLMWHEGRRWIIAVAASIYLYSAAGKLDYQFVHTVGSEMIQAMTRPLGGVDPELAVSLAMALPASELSIGVLILIPKTRRLGGVLAIGMHATLIAILGPWMLGHSWGVLTWNSVLAIQSWILFVRPAAGAPATGSEKSNRASDWVLRCAIIVILVMPLVERFGYWDHWTSWALYSPHNSRAETEVHSSVVRQMPAEMVEYLGDDDDADGWSELQIERWSLDRRWVPVYPQGRYQLAAADRLAKEFNLGNAVRVQLKSVSDRWDGTRRESFLIGQNEIDQALQRYWLVVRTP